MLMHMHEAEGSNNSHWNPTAACMDGMHQITALSWSQTLACGTMQCCC